MRAWLNYHIYFFDLFFLGFVYDLLCYQKGKGLIQGADKGIIRHCKGGLGKEGWASGPGGS